MEQGSAFLPSILALGSVLVAAGVLTVARPHLRSDVRQSARFSIVMTLTILMQAGHFIEELRSGFFVMFPATFGLPPISESFFVWFNMAWLVIWALALVAVRYGVRLAALPLWFLSLAMILNLIAHPLLAIREGGYFPGLVTAPLVGILGVLSIREMMRLTANEASA